MHAIAFNASGKQLSSKSCGKQSDLCVAHTPTHFFANTHTHIQISLHCNSTFLKAFGGKADRWTRSSGRVSQMRISFYSVGGCSCSCYCFLEINCISCSSKCTFVACHCYCCQHICPTPTCHLPRNDLRICILQFRAKAHLGGIRAETA